MGIPVQVAVINPECKISATDKWGISPHIRESIPKNSIT